MKSEFADWLEKKYLSWQIENGRGSIRKWSEGLGINHALIVQYMNDKEKPGPKIKPILAEQLGDEVYDKLGEPRPNPTLRLLEAIAERNDPEDQELWDLIDRLVADRGGIVTKDTG